MIETPERRTRNAEPARDRGTDDLARAALAMIAEAEAMAAGSRYAGRLSTLRRVVARRPVFVLAGEFNSGKSSLCNLLSGIDALPTDFLATTSVPTHLYFAESPELAGFTPSGERRALEGPASAAREPLARIAVGFPADVLLGFELVDTPGLADPDVRDGEAVLGRVRADAVIWCTPATQAWKESERVAWMKLPARLRRATVVALTFADLAPSDAEIARVRARLEREAGPFRAIVPIASRPGRESGRGDLLAVCDALADDLVLRRVERAATILQRLLRSL